MQINCTVIIQAFNFLVTYLFLRKFLFRPTVQLIKQKDTAKKILTEKLRVKELVVGNLIAKKSKDLEWFRSKIMQRYHRPAPQAIQIEPDVLSNGQRVVVTQEVIKECKDVVTKGVTNVL